MDLVGCCVDIKQLLGTELGHDKLTKMVGDGWHLRPQGMLLMWVLSNLELRTAMAQFPRSLPCNSESFESPSKKRFKQRCVAPDDSDAEPQSSQEAVTPGSALTICSSIDE